MRPCSGSTPAIGAFLAGSIIAGLPNGRQFEQAIRPFSSLFAPFFFLSIGMLIDPASLAGSAGPAVVLIGAFLLTVFMATSLSFFLISGSGRSSVFVGLAMLPLGEFSLLIAKEGMGVVQANLVGIAAAGVLVTSLLCSVALGRSDRLYISLRQRLPPRFLDTLRDSSGYFRNVISAFEPRGYFHKMFVSELKKSYFDAVWVLAAALLFWLGRPQLQSTLDVFGRAVPADMALLAVLVPLSLIPLVRILVAARRLFDALSTIFSRTTPQAHKVVLIRNVLVSALFFVLFINSPLMVDALLLPQAFNWVSIVFLAFSAFFFWSAIRAASFWFFLHERTPINILRSPVLASRDDLIVVASAPKGGKHIRGARPAGREKKVIFLR